MAQYTLKKKLGSFAKGSVFEGKPAQTLSVVDNNKDGINHFLTVKLSDKEWFGTEKLCPKCGQTIK